MHKTARPRKREKNRITLPETLKIRVYCFHLFIIKLYLHRTNLYRHTHTKKNSYQQEF